LRRNGNDEKEAAMTKKGGTKKGRPAVTQTRQNGEETRTKIVNAAELLFGRQSFDTVSLRDITVEAGVTLALASYHFRTKENLFAAVVTRRAEVLNRIRRERLAALDRKGKPTLEGLLDAFMRPLFEQMKANDEGWRAYLLLLASMGTSERWLPYLHENFDETASLFIERLKAILPDVEEEDLLRGFSMILVLMLQTVSKNKRLDTLSDGRYLSADLDKSYTVLLTFALAGLNALRKT
jgi:AcrR family transcriptional regulator